MRILGNGIRSGIELPPKQSSRLIIKFHLLISLNDIVFTTYVKSQNSFFKNNSDPLFVQKFIDVTEFTHHLRNDDIAFFHS